jgi:hypothetical protein
VAKLIYSTIASLAAEAFRAGLVDECHLVLAPVVVGGGTRSLPEGVPCRARAARRAAVRQRHGLPQLPRSTVIVAALDIERVFGYGWRLLPRDLKRSGCTLLETN